jgi:adenine-specific DNA-methyltransferase
LLAFLTRTELLQLAADYEHPGLTAKPKDEIIDAIVEYSQPSKKEVLKHFSRAQLKSACEELGLDTTGREKQVLIDRLLGREDDDDDSGKTSDGQGSSRPARPRPGELPIDDYRHEDVTRKNIPPAKLAAEGRVPKVPPVQYAYSPRRPPALRFDSTGVTDAYFELLDQAKLRPLTEIETEQLRNAFALHEPWLEWAGKLESDKRGAFAVDPVALHIHERVSTQAILKIAARQDVERTLFGDPEQAYHDAVQFYRHDMDWTNRLILGDSLQVMTSLARREDLASKVQMIYVDPPYGIKFASNFQSLVGRKDVKDKDADLTRELEQVRAYRDTWELGTHSYLSYLRQRLVVVRSLLSETGSVFVQIGEENVHRVRQLMDDTFGPSQSVATIAFKSAVGLGASVLDTVTNYVLWYVRDIEQARTRPLFRELTLGQKGATRYLYATGPTGETRHLTEEEEEDPTLIPEGWEPFFRQGLTSRSAS